jgi:ABC-type transport system substrate-binding protein
MIYSGGFMKKTTAWWEKLGKPQYGGEMVLHSDRNIVNFDPYYDAFITQIFWTWMESFASGDWTYNPAELDFGRMFLPNQYRKGQLAESWGFTDPTTFVVHLRQGIHWQDIPPVNGHDFTADDVAYHYHRLWGLGSGMKPSPDHASVPAYKTLESVTAIDRYTVVFKWKAANPEHTIVSLLAPNPTQVFEAREAVEKWGDLSDWHHAIGTGPFILQDFVSGRSATLAKNPNYWGRDERYPYNQLPYVDNVRFMIIPDHEEALAAMRAGKIDFITPVSMRDAETMQKTNPEIVRVPIPFPQTVSVDPRLDKEPFNDIRVRKAMQMAVDLPAIARGHYHGTAEPYPAALASRGMKPAGFPYEEWPQDLKDEYAYNPAAARTILAGAGFPNGFKTNVVADNTGDMALLGIVKDYLSQVGIDMEIRPMSTADWNDYVLIKRQHDQMAQRAVAAEGYAFEPIRMLHGIQTGHSMHQMFNDPVCDSFYPRALAATTLEERLAVYREANEYMLRQHFSIFLLQPKSYALCQPWFKGFYGQWGSVIFPAVLSFDLARFWIDGKLKKSMGY